MTTKDKIVFATRELVFYLLAINLLVCVVLAFSVAIIYSAHKIERFCAMHPQVSESSVLAIIFSVAAIIVSVAAVAISCWRKFRE